MYNEALLQVSLYFNKIWQIMTINILYVELNV